MGETIIGNYRLEEPIGRGGMGVVYRGRHLQLPREVAIKSINLRHRHDLRRHESRFQKEAFIQSQLDHPGIVKIYDYIVAEQTYYIIMELVQGRSLAQLCASRECPLPVRRALNIFEQILAAVAHAHSFVYRDQNGSAHRGLIHRDLKPGNILITPDDRIKITDFGIVKLVGSENTDTFTQAYGSPQYVSPEQAEGARVDQRSDIYSLGIILYEMLTGAPPFGNKDEPLSRTEILRAHVERTPHPPSEINDQVTPEIEAVILRALAKEPAKRFPTATEFLRALRHASGRDTGDLTIEESPAPPPQNYAEIPPEYDPAMVHTASASYVTQPIRTAACEGCGTAPEPYDERCRQCGQTLSASPATAKLTHEDQAVWQSKRARGVWLVGALIVLALLSAVIFYVRHRSSNEPPAPVTPQATDSQPGEAAIPTPVPEAELVEVKPARVEVDSTYDGYSTAPLTDGEVDVRRIAGKRYNAGNWVSAEEPGSHWIELAFAQPTRIAAVYVYWGFDRDRFMPSRRVSLRIPDASGSWEPGRTVAEMEPGKDYDRTAFDFTPITTERVRILQPAQQGPANRPFVMWVREIKVFGIAGGAPSP